MTDVAADVEIFHSGPKSGSNKTKVEQNMNAPDAGVLKDMFGTVSTLRMCATYDAAKWLNSGLTVIMNMTVCLMHTKILFRSFSDRNLTGGYF